MSDRTREFATVLEHTRLADTYYRLRLAAPVIAKRCHPGQFVFIRVGEGTQPLLRRPISICDADPQNGEVVLLYRTVGHGTELLARVSCGSQLDLMGPIGTPFPEDCTQAVLIAGGMGAAPLHLLARRLHQADVPVTMYYGAKTEEQLFLSHSLSSFSSLQTAAEQDGTTVLSLLPAQLPPQTTVYACGPVAMLRRVQQWAEQCGARGFVSLEERLACGIGACSGCAFPMHGPNGKTMYKKVCVDGPVFPMEEVVFDA